MDRFKKPKKVSITAVKTNKIEFLMRQVNDANTRVAIEKANYTSFVEKANTFANLYSEKEVDRQNTEDRWNLYLKVKSSLNANRLTSEEANLVAVEAFHDMKKLIIQWEKITRATLKAAEAIQLAADFIQKRKASNPLISDELVEDAIAAAQNSEKAVKIVIKALTDSLGALSSSTQAKNATELTDVYLDIAAAMLLPDPEKVKGKKLQLSAVSKLGLNKEETDRVGHYLSHHKPLETSIRIELEEAREKSKKALLASERANKEMNKAKEQLDQAEADLS